MRSRPEAGRPPDLTWLNTDNIQALMAAMFRLPCAARPPHRGRRAAKYRACAQSFDADRWRPGRQTLPRRSFAAKIKVEQPIPGGPQLKRKLCRPQKSRRSALRGHWAGHWAKVTWQERRGIGTAAAVPRQLYRGSCTVAVEPRNKVLGWRKPGRTIWREYCDAFRLWGAFLWGDGRDDD